MTEPTGPASPSRPPVVPIVLGLLLVAVVIAAALVIERATDNDRDLPGTLPGGYRADPHSDLLAAAEDHMSDVLGAPVTIGAYRSSDTEQEFTIIVVDEAPGPYAPAGAQAAPEAHGLERGTFELVRESGAICQVYWPAVILEGQDVPEDDPVAVKCQLGVDDRTYWLDNSSGGLSVDAAVEILDEVAD